MFSFLTSVFSYQFLMLQPIYHLTVPMLPFTSVYERLSKIMSEISVRLYISKDCFSSTYRGRNYAPKNVSEADCSLSFCGNGSKCKNSSIRFLAVRWHRLCVEMDTNNFF